MSTKSATVFCVYTSVTQPGQPTEYVTQYATSAQGARALMTEPFWANGLTVGTSGTRPIDIKRKTSQEAGIYYFDRETTGKATVRVRIHEEATRPELVKFAKECAARLKAGQPADFRPLRPVVEAPAAAPGAGGEPVTLAQLEENAGLLEASATGAQGGWVAVYLASRQGIDVGGAQFAVVCEHHGNIGAAVNIPKATELLRQPALFCPDCCGHLASQPAKLEAGLEGWQRRALIDMALGQDPEADLPDLVALPDEELVRAAGFVPMLPALLQSDWPRQ
jgi:hypothetical protein